jgi:hypothetical protein
MWRTGLDSASRRNGSPSSFVTIISITVVLPSAWLRTDCAMAAPTSDTLSTRIPSQPKLRATAAQLGLTSSTPW